MVNILQKQRNELSAAMMNMSKELLQIQCKVSAGGISSHGGWCGNPKSLHKTDTNLASALVRLFHGDTVASFGDGMGTYKTLIDKSGQVKLYDGFDGAPFSENSTKGLVKFLDLSIPAYGLMLYDWVLSLEVAEHIPKQYEQTYIDNLARHAAKGIVLSWAVPKQPGHGHVNNQPLDYVIKQFNARGFYHNKTTSQQLQSVCKLWWLKKNVNVFMRNAGEEPNLLML
jgi:hypothetical protein